MYVGRRSYAIEEQAAHARLDDHFGDFWTHQSVIARPNFPAAVDPTKPGYMLVAKFEYDSRTVKLGLEESGIVSNDPVITIDLRQLQRPITRGDRFTRLATHEVYEVTDSKPDGASGVIINLQQMGRKAE